MTFYIAMKLHQKQRFVLFLCVLLIGEEFAKAKTILDELDTYKLTSEENNGHFTESYRNDNDDDDDQVKSKPKPKVKDTSSKRMKLVPQKPIDECGGNKRWISGIFKGIKIFTQVAKYTSLGVILTANIYSAIRKCKDIEPMAETYTKMYGETYEKTKELARVVDDLQKQAEDDQNFIDGTAEILRKIMCKLNEIDQDSATMLTTISPEVTLVAENASREIEQLAEESKELEYVDIEQLYSSPLQTALGIALPAVMLAFPAGKALFKLARKRFMQRSIGLQELKNKIKLKLPSKLVNLKKFAKVKFSSWIGRVQTRAASHMSKVFGKFNKFFSKIGKIAKAFKSVLKSALTVAGAAYFAFEQIKSMLDNCRAIKDQAKSAYDQVSDAYDKINGTLQDIKEHRDRMAWAWKLMRGNLTEDMFLKSVGKTMAVMKDAANQSRPMQEISERLENFLNVINTTNDLNTTFDLTEDLYNSLIKVPFAYVCYTSKINIVNNVVRSCKSGDESLNSAIEYNKNRFDESIEGDPGSPKRCKDDMGMDYLPDESIVQSWLGTAQENGYHPVCYMNNKQTRDNICDLHFYDDKYHNNAAQIAADYNKDQEEVQQVIDLLPKEKPLHKNYRGFVCILRSKNASDEEILKQIKPFAKSATIQQVKSLECNELNQGLCIPIKKAIKEAWEKQKIEMPTMPTLEEEEEEEEDDY